MSLLHARQAEGQAAVVLDQFGIDHIDVERRIGHDEIAVAPQWTAILQTMQVFVEGIGFADVAFQSMYGKIHFGQADGGGGFFLAVESDTLHRVQPFVLNEMAGLHEHAAGTAGQIE